METNNIVPRFQALGITSSYHPPKSSETAEFCRKDTKDLFKLYNDWSDSESDPESESEKKHVHITIRNLPIWLYQDMQMLAFVWISSFPCYPIYRLSAGYVLEKETRKLTCTEMMLVRRYALVLLILNVEQHRQTSIEAHEWFQLDYWASIYINNLYVYHFFPK